jgi:hypothetical protein
MDKIESMRNTLSTIETELFEVLSSNSKSHLETMLDHVEKIVGGYQDHFTRCVSMSEVGLGIILCLPLSNVCLLLRIVAWSSIVHLLTAYPLSLSLSLSVSFERSKSKTCLTG